MVVAPERHSKLFALVALAGLLWPGAAAAQNDDVVFSSYVEPNVLFVMDNSLSMTEMMWHPDFDPDAVYSCTLFAPDKEFLFSGNTKLPAAAPCVEREILIDKSISEDTIYRGKYLNWLLSPEADTAYLDIEDGSNGTPSSCNGGSNYAKYQRSKFSVATRAFQEIICEVNQTTKVRVGAATFREPEGAGPDVNGGWVAEEIDQYSSTQASDITNSFNSMKIGTWSPLSETVFQLYTYFMSRTNADLPLGQDGATRFPAYQYAKDGDYDASGSKTPVSPVQFECQKNFIILISGGEPTRDDFQEADTKNEAKGFTNFDKLIGNYNADLEVELQDDLFCTDCQTAMYLDDIAYFMAHNDFRPDMDGDQLIDFYTISLSEDAASNDLLRRAAQLGNGTFTQAGSPEEMGTAIVDAFNSIIAKAQSFAAATVPASRTSDGGKIYVSQFIPSEDDPYWIGHLKSYQISAAGEILDKDGNCALDDPIAGQCYSGKFKETAKPYWNAFDVIPSPGSRNNLTVSSSLSGTPAKVAFDDTLTDIDLGVVFPSVEVYPNSTALNANGLKDEIVANVRGCVLGTGVLSTDVATPVACEPRPAIQNDIFHSNPVVVGPPSAYDPSPSYGQFATNYGKRDRIIIAGSNGGFLQGFLAGEWNTTLSPPAYDAGTGVEVFGFMPWPAREKIRFKPIDTGGRDYYFVDGSPSVSDVWLYSAATTAPKLASGIEWKTVVVGGMREGGEAYYALDVTDPSDADYPKYMWEFPSELAPASLKQYIGNTWSDPVLTRIKVQVGLDGNDLGDGNGPQGYERWVMIVAGGYDPSGDPNNIASYDSTATKGRGIFIVDVKTGEVLAQQVFTPGSGDVREEMIYAIPSSPGVFDLDFDGFADVIYVGDLGGNLWKWVIEPIGFDRVNGTGTPDDQPNWNFRKLFSAPIGTTSKGVFDHYKSFFFPPVATFKGGQLWLAFASGERANLAFAGVLDNKGDPDVGEPEDNNRFYALKDDDPLETLVTPQAKAGESLMLELDQSKPDICADASSYRGYYYIAEDAEKFIVNLELFLGYVFVGSFFPTDVADGDVCGVRGQAFLSVFRIDCGEGYFDDGGDPEKKISLGPGLPTDPRVTVGNDDGSGGGNRVIVNRQDGAIVNFEAPPGFSTFGMFYWRELHQ